MTRAFLSDEEAAALRDATLRSGAGEIVAVEILMLAEETRCNEHVLTLLKHGRVVPSIVDGALKFALSDSARDELAGKLAAVAIPRHEPWCRLRNPEPYAEARCTCGPIGARP